MDHKDGETGLSAEHECSLKGSQNRHILQLLQRHGNPTHAVAAGKSGTHRNHKSIYAAARNLKPAQRGKDKPSNTGPNKHQRFAHARLQPLLTHRLTNPHQQYDITAQIQIERQVNTKKARYTQTEEGNYSTDSNLVKSPNLMSVKQQHQSIKQQP